MKQGRTRVFRREMTWLLAVLVCTTGCSMNTLALRSVTGMFATVQDSLEEESDLLLAERFLESSLALLEGLLRSDPRNRQLLLLVTKGFGSYAFGFVEDQDTARASGLYRRATGYGLEALKRNRRFARAMERKDIDLFERSLTKFKKKDLPILFWTAFSWASWVSLNKDSTDAIADAPRVQLLIARCLQLDEHFFYGGPHLLSGTYFSRSRILGGDPEKARFHFGRAGEISEGRFLLPYFLYARYYAVQIQDRELFERELRKILDTPADILPQQRLINEIVKRKATGLLAETDEYF